MSILALPAALFLAQAQAPAPAPDWEVVQQDRMLTVSWDRAGVVRDGDLVRVPVKTELAIVAGHGVFIFEIRCSDSKLRTIRTDSHQADGEVLSEETPRARFESIRRGSYERRIRDAVC